MRGGDVTDGSKYIMLYCYIPMNIVTKLGLSHPRKTKNGYFHRILLNSFHKSKSPT